MSDVGTKLWANSGDSHYMEPPDLYEQLPEHLRDKMPRTVRDEEAGVETITVDGQTFERSIPKPRTAEQLKANAARPADDDLDEPDGEERAPGAFDPDMRLVDLDKEGIWARGDLPVAGHLDVQHPDPRDRQGGLPDLQRFLHRVPATRRPASSSPPPSRFSTSKILSPRSSGPRTWASSSVSSLSGRRWPSPLWQNEEWDPVWEALERNGMVLGFHIGTEPVDPTGRIGIYYRGRGGAVLNYVETTYGGQRAVSQLIACGCPGPTSRPADPRFRGGRDVGSLPGRPHG